MMNAVFLKKIGHSTIFFTVVNGKAVCLICKNTVSVFKEYNLERHFNTKHAGYSVGLSAEQKLQNLRI